MSLTRCCFSLSAEERVSFEDERRPLPEGWIRQFDQASGHHFYVDTRATPPRSIWVHPDDEKAEAEASKTGQTAATHQTKSPQTAAHHDDKKKGLGEKLKDKISQYLVFLLAAS